MSSFPVMDFYGTRLKSLHLDHYLEPFKHANWYLPVEKLRIIQNKRDKET